MGGQPRRPLLFALRGYYNDADSGTVMVGSRAACSDWIPDYLESDTRLLMSSCNRYASA